MPKTMKELRAEVRRLLAENHDLRRQVEELTSRLSS
jgi:regulator of replication initiation timing